MKKRTLAMLTVAVLVLSLSLFSCGGGEQDQQKETTQPKEEVTQNFTTTDGKYTITIGEEWTEADPYSNDDATLELDNDDGMSWLLIIDQEKAGLGYTLSSYNETVINDLEMTLSEEGTTDVSLGSYTAKRSLVSGEAEGMKIVAGIMVIETENDYIQLIVSSTESRQEQVMQDLDDVAKSITAN